ncbi:unnamed protein product [Cuscuta europaea]|uniref:Uncharacterized protein n=1 Tax=Cuscuta europaea TaxID=41803 RepID=A0A9P0Z1N3_CUSEU|nr:unnamed protein product [Cuscuta europaea]
MFQIKLIIPLNKSLFKCIFGWGKWGCYIPRPPSPQKKGTKKKKALSFKEWRLGGSQVMTKTQFEEMKQKMTSTQQQNLYLDHDGHVKVKHGGSLEEAEFWFHNSIVPGKDIHEGVLNYLDCKLSPVWASYQRTGNLVGIREEVNAELKRLQGLDEQARAEAAKTIM